MLVCTYLLHKLVAYYLFIILIVMHFQSLYYLYRNIILGIYNASIYMCKCRVMEWVIWLCDVFNSVFIFQKLQSFLRILTMHKVEYKPRLQNYTNLACTDISFLCGEFICRDVPTCSMIPWTTRWTSQAAYCVFGNVLFLFIRCCISCTVHGHILTIMAGQPIHMGFGQQGYVIQFE